MLQVNCFTLTVVLFYGCQLWDLSSNYIEDIYVAWQNAIRRIFNLPCNTHRYLLPFVAGSSHIQVKLVNRFNNFFNALMSSDNNIIERLVYNCHFSNTPLGINKKIMNMYNCYKCNEVEEAHGALLLAWMFDAQIGLSLSFRKMRLKVWSMMFVSINLDILWWWIFQMSEYHVHLSLYTGIFWIRINYWTHSERYLRCPFTMQDSLLSRVNMEIHGKPRVDNTILGDFFNSSPWWQMINWTFGKSPYINEIEVWYT